MNESFLHFLWKYKNFNLNHLKTIEGESLTILRSGIHNTESGPDFSNAQIKINQIVWVGQVEIHLKSSDWYRHNHQFDKAYDNTILHVVWEYDKDVLDKNNVPIPTLELKGRISKWILKKYHELELSKHELVCQDLTKGLDSFKTQTWLNRLTVSRVESKTEQIFNLLERHKGNWSQTFFVSLSKNLGFKTNALPMQLLAESVAINQLIKHRNSLLVIESILYGVSGLLDETVESEYGKMLKKEYAHQQALHGFQSLNSSIWKFGGVRPINFPTIRIAQLAKLIYLYGDLFHELVRDLNVEIKTSKLQVLASPFWDMHFTFSKESNFTQKKLGINSSHNILINTVIPFQFLYGKTIGNSKYQNVALQLLEKLPSETNSIVSKWKENNIIARNAADSQSLIQLTNTFCKPKNCLNCGIGSQILNEKL